MVWMPASVAASFHEKCVWASHMPGISVAPAPSITVAPLAGMLALPRPTFLMRLPCTSTLPGTGLPPLPSRMRTLVKRVLFAMTRTPSGGPAGGGGGRAGSAAHRRRAVELAVLHHREDAALVLQHRDVGQRVAVDQQDVGEVALADVAQHLAHA